MADTIAVRYTRNPLIKGFVAEFTTGFGTEYQILAFEEEVTVRFGVRNVECSGTDWSYGSFRYADSWRDKNNYPVAWNPTTFKQMVEDFMADADGGK
jgi:hypothetical protein